MNALAHQRRRSGHSESCTCEECMKPVVDFWEATGFRVEKDPEPEPAPQPLSRAELQAALDRAYNLGVEQGRRLEGRVAR